MDKTTLLLYILGGIALALTVIILIMVIPTRRAVEKTVRMFFDQRKGLKDIVEYGRKRKWNEREVKLYYLAFTMRDFKQRGYGLEEIRNMAEDSHWPRDMIDIVLGKLT